MDLIALGVLGFLVVHLFDFVALKRIPLLKPVIWASGCGILFYAIAIVTLSADRLVLALWLNWLGWILLPVSILLVVYSLFVNLPLVNTYLKRGIGKRLVKTELYTLVRHPGIYGFILFMAALWLVSGSRPLLVAAPVWILLDIILVVIQDRYFFGRMFPAYEQYRQQTPMLIPNKQSIRAFLDSFRQLEDSNPNIRRTSEMSTEAELFQQGRYDELWQRCCGFIDLSLDEFMRIQRRLLMEQLELLGRCKLGQIIMNGASPESVAEFRRLVPMTTYADYAPYLLKRRMDVMPKKPILWQCTSGKSGEYPYLWAPITARQLEELEPLIFALLFLASCNKKGEINLKGHEKCFYGMAPPPYATGTLTRVFPHHLFETLPPVEESETMSFGERTRKGFNMALEKGLDMNLCMSSVAVAIGERFSQHGKNGTGIGNMLRKPGATLRLIKGITKSKLARRPLMPKDLWKLKSLVTFGIDGSTYREKIKEMWGRYPLNFHGCTEATIIAMQMWDYNGMTFVPNLNFFEFIPEAEAIRSREDTEYQPSTLLMNELKPGRYELVITSLHGGPFIRYRIGHMIEITALRNEKLGIDIPQMEYLCRVDDQIDIAGFTRLSEKIIWEAVEKAKIPHRGWVVRREVMKEPILHLYIEMKGSGLKTAESVRDVVHEELKKLDAPYAELEEFTGLKPLKVTLLPQGAFKEYKLKQQAEGAELAHMTPTRLNPPDEEVKFLVSVRSRIAAEAEVKEKIEV